MGINFCPYSKKLCKVRILWGGRGQGASRASYHVVIDSHDWQVQVTYLAQIVWNRNLIE